MERVSQPKVSSAQTDPLRPTNCASQTTTFAFGNPQASSVSTQTNAVGSSAALMNEHRELMDTPQFVRFLQSVGPAMLEALSVPTIPRYLSAAGMSSDKDLAELLHSLTVPFTAPSTAASEQNASMSEEDPAEKARVARLKKFQSKSADTPSTSLPSSAPSATNSLDCTCVAFNSTGNVVAVGYSRPSVTTICNEPSLIAVWNLRRRTLDVSRPDLSFETSSYVTALAFHPTNPAILLAGTFHGEVIVYDASATSDAALLFASQMNDERSHRESVTFISVLVRDDDKDRDLQLVSASQDGKVVVWVAERDTMQLRPIASLSVVKRGGLSLGISSAAFQSMGRAATVQTSLFVGCEMGDVARCALSVSSVSSSTSSLMEDAKSCAQLFYSPPHIGPVMDVSCSPFHRHIFLTCGADGVVRLWSSLSPQAPRLTLEPVQGQPVLAVCFSPVRPLVFACALASGRVLVYDLGDSQLRPVCVLDGSTAGVCWRVRFNEHDARVLATVHADGSCKVWRLPDGLVDVEPGEVESLGRWAEGEIVLT
jgi:WD40 repeat protein